MRHTTSPDDERFIADLESGTLPPDQFDHRAHVRAAYIYLTRSSPEQAAANMRDTLKHFLERNDPAKYHETITKAWILAVRHFMERTPAAMTSSDAFIDANPELIDTKIMMTNKSARTDFVEPDIGPIPRHGEL